MGLNIFHQRPDREKAGKRRGDKSNAKSEVDPGRCRIALNFKNSGSRDDREPTFKKKTARLPGVQTPRAKAPS